MTGQNQDNSDDLFMLDLFRNELESAIQTLDKGLVDIESELSQDTFDSIVRAAHSIKGAARIVGLDSVVTLAATLEDILSSIRDGKIIPIASQIDLLRSSTEIFRGLSALTATEIPGSLKKEEKKIDSICKKLRELLTSKPVEDKKEETVRNPPEMKSVEVIHEEFDTSMLELFRVEVENHSHVLEKGLLEIESDSTPEKIEPLMRAAHSIKGAARIMNLNLEVSLAHAMEDVLSAAQHKNLVLTSEFIDILLRSNDIFLYISSLDVDKIPQSLVDSSLGIKKLTQSLIDILAGKPFETSLQAAMKYIQEPLEKKATAKKEELYVRVLTENMNRILSLAGESLVHAKSASSFYESWLIIKEKHLEIASNLENAILSTWDTTVSNTIKEKILESSKILESCRVKLYRQIENFEIFSRHLENAADRLYSEVVGARMRPFSDGILGFPRMIRDLAKKQGKQINFVILGESTRVDGDILEKLESPLTHILRNAVDHGIETPEERLSVGKQGESTIQLEARHIYGMLNIIIRDDGRGINIENIREKAVQTGQVSADMAANLSESELYDFLFLPGFSTQGEITEVSGRGVGLDVVSAMLQAVGGNISIQSQQGKGTTFRLLLPLTLSVLPTLVVEINNEPYALPLTKIDHVLEVLADELHVIGDQHFCSYENELIGVVNAQQILQLSPSNKTSDTLKIAIFGDRLSHRSSRHGLVVDRLIGQYELVVRSLDPRLGKIPNISAGAIMEDGSTVLIMDIDDIVHSIDSIISDGRIEKVGGTKKQRAREKKRILVVDDSLTVREVERKLLQNHGYVVHTAVDGIDGWNKLTSGTFDLIISDVDMPRMNGIEFVKKIKNDPKQKALPVMIISYKDREVDKLKGLKAGANYYLTKASFHDESLLEAVRDLIGEPE